MDKKHLLLVELKAQMNNQQKGSLYIQESLSSSTSEKPF